MSAIVSDDESELVHVLGSESVANFSELPQASPPAQNRTKKRWSFHNNVKPDLINSDKSGTISRRLSDRTDKDGVHKEIDPYHISPAQLYSTESGRLFNSGKFLIVICGLPARGKTHLTVSLTRYLRWLGVKTHSFHVGDYRRKKSNDVAQDFFIPNPTSAESSDIRNKVFEDCLNDILNFFDNDKGQVSIFDAVNALSSERTELNRRFAEFNIKTLFIESLVDNDTIIMKNVQQAAKSSPDYVNWDFKEAADDYLKRINITAPYYEEMNEKELSYIKFINFGERIILNNSHYGYLINKVVFYLMNSSIKSGSVFFARCFNNKLAYKSDPPLDEDGKNYAKKITDTLKNYLLKTKGDDYFEKVNLARDKRESLSTKTRQPALGVDGTDEDSFVIWTSAKRRTIETTKYFRDMNINIRHRIQLTQKNPGVVDGLSEEQVRSQFGDEYEHYMQDPYHYRFSRAESYHDLAIKIEPLIMEMERMSGDLLIIADETVLRVFYGYLMALSCYDIPSLSFGTDEIIEVKFNAYSNILNRIKVEHS